MRALQMEIDGLAVLDGQDLSEIRGGMPLMAAAIAYALGIGAAAGVGIVVGLAIYAFTH